MKASSGRAAVMGRMGGYFDRIAPYARYSDLGFAGAICLILAVLFVPLPPFLLDIGLALSFAISIVVLMVALWVNKPLEFNSFPTLLLVVTVMRLALSVASTRLILSEGHTGTGSAGHVIEGIANFVVGGDYIIGSIIFAILVVINFIVITKGSTRIAEVSARFSLDAMPGKQMAIDADLGAGMIDETEARRRRDEVEGESGFFGAMDGAAKFVRGDAVAGIIITLVNILGGLLIGTVRHGLDFATAAQTYTVLTIGDGLVSQIPALIVSIAAGLVVTKGAAKGNAAEAVSRQLSAQPRALYAAAFLTAGLGLLPGFPIYVFWPLAFLVASVGMMTSRRVDKEASDKAATEARAAQIKEPEKPEDLVKVDTVSLDLGSGLIMMIDDQDAALPGKIRSLRNFFAKKYGFILPQVRIRDASDLAAGEYRISIQGIQVARDSVIVGSRLLIDPSEEVRNIPGVRVKDPAFGLSSLWIDAARSVEAEAMGLTVVDPESVMTTHLTEVLTSHMPELLTYGATQELLKTLAPEYQKLLQDIPGQNPAIMVCQVLRNLLSQRVSVRSLPLIVEALSEVPASMKNPEIITEHVRRKLAAQICSTLEDRDGYVKVMVLSEAWEAEFVAAVSVRNDEIACVMSPRRVEDFVRAAQIEIQKFASRDEWPAILVRPDHRPVIGSMLSRVSHMNQVISHAELYRTVKLRTVGTIGG